MSMLDTLPTVEEMMVALSSPIVPDAETSDATMEPMELSTDEMIKAIFNQVMAPPAVS